MAILFKMLHFGSVNYISGNTCCRYTGYKNGAGEPNLSAAMRCLQIVYENLGDVLDKKPKDVRLKPWLKNYVETTAQRILSGQLFFE